MASLRSSRVALCAMMLIALALGVLIVGHSYRAIKRELTDAALSRRSSVSYLAAVTLSEKFDRVVDIGVSLATRVQFRALVEARHWDGAVEILKRTPSDFPFIDRLYLSTPDGTLMADIPPLEQVKGQSVADREWYQGVSREWQSYVSVIYQRAAPPRNNVVAVATPIRTKAGGVAGILVLEINLDRFFDWMRSLDTGDEGQLYVVDRTGTVAFHPEFSSRDELRSFAHVPMVGKSLQGNRGVEVSLDPVSGEENIVAYDPVAKYGWGVVVQQPASVAFAARNAQLVRMLVAYGLIVAFGVLVIHLSGRLTGQKRREEADRRVKDELERQVAERTAQLQRSNEELESFSYSISHDLRTPLRVINGFTRILEEEAGPQLDTQAKQHLAVIRDSTLRMGKLIEDLLAFARMGRGKITTAETDMSALAQAAYQELCAGPTPGAQVQFTVKPLPPAWVDAALFRQVWTNLLSNGLKFTSGTAAPCLEVGAMATEEEDVYYVKDNGAGFDMRYCDKLFGVFERLHGTQEFPGTGIGLAIVQRVIERHGGRVWAEGVVGGGATFYFALRREGRGQPAEGGAAKMSPRTAMP